MPRFTVGTVVEVLKPRGSMARMIVKAGRTKRSAVAYPAITGKVTAGDRVVINTTGTDLELGTGGDDFVVWNLERQRAGTLSGGHIVKLRYTPMQFDVVAAESPEGPGHKTLKNAISLEGMPVVACGLHSQLAPVAAVLKQRDPDINIVYLMTDGASLAIDHSDLVASLKQKKLIDATVTTGHCFGGDLECVNVYSGLLASGHVLGADVVVSAVGPGIVGTGTALGHTGMDQGLVLTAAGALGGRAVAVLRVSFADSRKRHKGVSHHTLTALKFGAVSRCTIGVPNLGVDELNLVMNQLVEYGLNEMHDVVIVDAWGTKEALEAFELREVTTMGRTMSEDPAFFDAAGAAGFLAGGIIYDQ